MAIIGCGTIARGTNVPGFLQDPRCRVTTVCDIVELAPDYVAEKWRSEVG